jgi:hypothetical protein
MQSNSPEIAIPPGVDIVELAEVGLRVLGLDAGEARHIATSTDWRSTLLVPVPLNASTFRQVTVRGNQGLLITMSGQECQRRTGAPGHGRDVERRRPRVRGDRQPLRPRHAADGGVDAVASPT